MKVEEIKLYEDREDVTLTTYVLADSAELLGGKPRPAVLICPGGAYLSCSDREAEPVALKFASMGYHAFVLRYSVYQDGEFAFPDLSKPLTPKKKCQNPMPMREVGKAMLIIREHAEEWLVDVDRIAVCGFSAGAHNAAMYAANWQTEILSEYFQEEPAKFRPAACILGYTLSDYVLMREHNANGPEFDAMFFGISNTAFLGEPTPSEEKLIAASPARNVTENMPPTFLWATSEDSLVPVQQSLVLARALADAKIPFELHVFENGPHGLALATQATAQAKAQVMPDVAKWTEMVDTWLEKRFALPILEELPAFDMPEGVL